MKVDVEGAELDVLRGMSAALSRDRPALLLEVLPAYQRDRDRLLGRQRELETLLKDAGYDLWRVRKSAGGPGGETYAGVDRVTEFGLHTDIALCDYVAAPADRSEALLAALTAD